MSIKAAERSCEKLQGGGTVVNVTVLKEAHALIVGDSPPYRF